MKTLTDAILFFMAMGLFMIGIYESMIVGISDSYWIFMISLSLLFLYGYRKNKNPEKGEKPSKQKKGSKNKSRKK